MNTDKLVYGADLPDEDTLALYSDTSADLPFSFPNGDADPDLCYAAMGCIRYASHYTLLRGQVLPFCNPVRGTYNNTLEFLLYLLVAKVRFVERDRGALYRFEIMCAGKPGFGNTQLHVEAGIHSFRAESTLGFLGRNYSLLSPVDRTDVHSMVVADGYSSTPGGLFERRSDGQLPFTPRFYVPTQGEGKKYFDVESRQWITLTELVDGPLFLPFPDPSEPMPVERLTTRLATRFKWGTYIYIGTDTMSPPTVDHVDKQHEIIKLLETRQDTSLGFDRQCEMGIRPGICRLPRAPSSLSLRMRGLRQVLNANGLYKLQKQCLAL
jgi:hypothetical protein